MGEMCAVYQGPNMSTEAKNNDMQAMSSQSGRSHICVKVKDKVRCPCDKSMCNLGPSFNAKIKIDRKVKHIIWLQR